MARKTIQQREEHYTRVSLWIYKQDTREAYASLAGMLHYEWQQLKTVDDPAAAQKEKGYGFRMDQSVFAMCDLLCTPAPSIRELKWKLRRAEFIKYHPSWQQRFLDCLNRDIDYLADELVKLRRKGGQGYPEPAAFIGRLPLLTARAA